jgi:hypothetical protein
MKKQLYKNYLILSLIVLTILGFSFYTFSSLNKNTKSDLGFQAVWAQEGETIKFTWAASNNEDVSSYKLYHGIHSGQYGENIETEGSNNFLILDVSDFSDIKHYFAVSALDESGNESNKSTELVIDLDIDINNPNVDTCGNGIVETDREEICDSNGRLCETDAGYLGEKYCNDDCSDYLATCVALQNCGDNIINGDEECEGTSTDIACSDGIYSGTATCSSCQISDCNIGSQTCGNDIIEGGEQCGDNDKFSENCLWNNTYPGTKSCDTNTCLWESECVKTPVCPDGFKDINEECDGSDFGNNSNSCSDWGSYSGGVVECNNSCQVDYSNCMN